MSASMDARLGTELAGYRLEALLGRGGMGVVYRARDLALDRDVALKLLAPHLAEDVSFRERFLTESRVAASLEHPNVVPIHDAGEIDGQLYIVMRLVVGQRPQGRVARRPARAGPGRWDRGADRERARRRSRAGIGAPRREAVERAARRARARLPGRLRLEPLPRRRGSLARPRPLARHRRLRRARADPLRGGRRPHRRLRARLPPLRVPRRRAAVSPWLGRGDAVRPARGRPAHPARPRGGAAEGAREGPRRPLPHLRRARRGRPRGARDHRAETQPLAPRRGRRRHRPDRRRARGFFLTRGDGGVPPRSPERDTLVRIDPETNKVADAIPVGRKAERGRGRAAAMSG